MSAASDRVRVELGTRSYDIRIEAGLMDGAGIWLAPFARNGRLILVSDETVWAVQGNRLVAALAKAGIEAVPILVPPGEASKSWTTLAMVTDRLLDLDVERADHILAFGGGMVGDLTGFAASILKRGCRFVQLPTTLLAQVDSSVGGKTAINSAAGKNLVGTFHQPAAVFIDPNWLDTLPPRQLRAGYAEVVKYGLIADPAFFRWCESEGQALLAGDPRLRHEAIVTSVQAKAAIVGEDERETGDRRALLNLGHTFGHALEAEAGFSDRLLHGEAVAIGMVLAFDYSARLELASPADAERVRVHLRSVGLPVSLADAGGGDPDRLVAHMMKDKKSSGGRTKFILARGIGKAFVETHVELSDVRDFLAEQARRA